MAALLVLGVLLLLATGGCCYDCGAMVVLTATGAGSTGELFSENYPDNYPNRLHCVWLIQAPNNYSVVFELTYAELQQDDDECLDFVEIRDGNSVEMRHFKGCNVTSPVTFTSSNRWLWLKFYSGDRGRSAGFTSNYSLIYTGADSGISPIDDCIGVHFQCRNQECVPYGYVCDRMNDCGCTGEGCDEELCGGLGWTMNAMIACGVGTGVATFLVIFIGIGLLELWLKKRQEEMNRKQKEEEIERSRSRRRRPPTKKPTPETVIIDTTASNCNSSPRSVDKLDMHRRLSEAGKSRSGSPRALDTDKLEVPKSPFTAKQPPAELTAW